MTIRAYILILVLFSSSPVGAQVGAVAAAATVDSVLAQIRNSLTSIISQTETSASVAGFSIAADANILLANLNSVAVDLEGKLFRDLNATQQAVIANA